MLPMAKIGSTLVECRPSNNFSNPIKCVVSGQDFKIKLDLKKYEKIEVDTVHFSILLSFNTIFLSALLGEGFAAAIMWGG